MQYFILAFLCLLTTAVRAQIPTNEPIDHAGTFKQIQVLSGGWFHASDQGDVVEEWKQVDDQTLVGTNYRVRTMDGDTTGEKQLKISLRPEGLYYTAQFRSINENKPVDYVLIFTENFDGLQMFTFENTKVDYPQRISYSVEENRMVKVKYEGQRNGRDRSEETSYDREFSAAGKEMYVRAGVGAFQMKTSGFFFTNPDEQKPVFEMRPSWELGAQLVFKGRGNFARFGLEFGLAGRFAYLDTASFTRIYPKDTVSYLRDGVKYNQTRVFVAFTPELRLDKNDNVTIFVGPYVSQGLITRTKGNIRPAVTSKAIFNANDDLGKTDFGLLGGVNVRLNPWKRDMGGRLGVRFWYGLSNLDNLYTVGCTQCTGKVTQRGFSVSYGVNLLK